MPARDCNGGALYKINTLFRPYVEELWKNGNFGLCRSKIDIEKYQYSGNDKNCLADQFTLILPYAGNYLRWEVLFDTIRPRFAPDFRFDDENFLSSVNADFIERHVSSLAQWDISNPKALSNVINELMQLYREYQKSLLCENKNSRAYFEYTALLGDNLTVENDIEILVGKGESVSLLIRLNIDCSPLPALFTESPNENPGNECAVILVKYPNPTKADLIMSPLVSKVVGDISLPPIHQTGVLMDYVPTVTDLINDRIMTVVKNEKLRQEVLTRLIVKYEGGILEHDSNTASFLLEVQDFFCILQIEIGVNYPNKSPTFILRSVYHSHNGKPKIKVLSNYQYNNIEEFIAQEINIFKHECTGPKNVPTELDSEEKV